MFAIFLLIGGAALAGHAGLQCLESKDWETCHRLLGFCIPGYATVLQCQVKAGNQDSSNEEYYAKVKDSTSPEFRSILYLSCWLFQEKNEKSGTLESVELSFGCILSCLEMPRHACPVSKMP